MSKFCSDFFWIYYWHSKKGQKWPNVQNIFSSGKQSQKGKMTALWKIYFQNANHKFFVTKFILQLFL